MQHGWFAFPVFFGDYPEVMKEFVGERSKAEGLLVSRLPTFDEEWQTMLKGNFFGELYI